MGGVVRGRVAREFKVRVENRNISRAPSSTVQRSLLAVRDRLIGSFVTALSKCIHKGLMSYMNQWTNRWWGAPHWSVSGIVKINTDYSRCFFLWDCSSLSDLAEVYWSLADKMAFFFRMWTSAGSWLSCLPRVVGRSAYSGLIAIQCSQPLLWGPDRYLTCSIASLAVL